MIVELFVNNSINYWQKLQSKLINDNEIIIVIFINKLINIKLKNYFVNFSTAF